ncbi:unnamed protein product (macronuclear) [Paramecium tetraurelia]|uniref:Uncharacterized protein n=1 Tax=Paramecium tetraurelia TaxID=5888 RepID=A0BSK3_PARTE|nr:uncharacterized protein GSPATT00031752001 [Paramecium tetraurelia]CAK61520.1 unnamed protein product [Paramecium tetraurelia]|eukprot:XP_001428918.1 hypothetical protein (macronuclear) [Paramecium tetraurelia strain d4-2]
MKFICLTLKEIFQRNQIQIRSPLLIRQLEKFMVNCTMFRNFLKQEGTLHLQIKCFWLIMWIEVFIVLKLLHCFPSIRVTMIRGNDETRASILEIDEQDNRYFNIFSESPENMKKIWEPKA